MKKLTLAMVLAILLSAFMPIMAEESNIEIALSSISEGDTYVCGNNIVLSAETNAADMKNIDFYANGDKLPGTVTESNGTLVWNTPSAGDYAVTAKANFTSGASAESDAVNISVKEDIKVISQMNTEDDVKLYKKGWGGDAIAETDISEEYSKFSKYSLHVTNMSTTTSPGTNPYIKLAHDNLGLTEDFEYFNLLLYNASEVDANYRVTLYFEELGTQQPLNLNPVKFANGWNKIAIKFADKFKNRTISEIVISTDWGNLYELNKEIDLTKVDYYINGMWLSNSNEAITATPSIPNSQTDVCNNLSKYTVTYNKAVLNPSIELYNGGEKITEGVSTKYGNDYARLVIEEGVLSFNTEYTVKVGAVEDIFGNTLAASEYKFTTIETNCDNVKPIPTVTYPSNGASVSTNATIAAKVIFTGNVEKVEFVENGTVLGEAAQYTGNEYQLNKTLATGSHTVSAKVTTKDNKTITTEAVTFTVGTAVSHCITGIADNTRFIVGSSVPKTIAVIDESTKGKSTSITNATDVAKAEFYIDDAKTYTSSAAPYTYELPVTAATAGEHEIKIKVYDIYGGMTEYGPYTYSVLVAKVNKSYANDFESGEPNVKVSATNENSYGFAETPSIVEYNNSKMLKMMPLNSTNKGENIGFGQSVINLSSTKYAVTELDLYRTDLGTRVWLQMRDNHQNRNFGTLFKMSENSSMYMKNTKYHVTIAADFVNYTYTTYVNGTEIESGSLNKDVTSTTIYPMLYFYNYTTDAVVYADNYSVKSYEEVSTSEIKEYALLGIETGDRFIANEGYSRATAVIDADKKGVNTADGKAGSTKLTNASNVEKVVFKIDGEKAAEVTTAPYSFNMPFNKIGTHTLTAEVTDVFGITHEYSANYEVIYGTVKAREVHDYEDGAIPAEYDIKNSTTENGGIAVSEHNKSNMLDIYTPNGAHGTIVGLMNGYKGIGTSEIVCAEFDVQRSARYARVEIQLADAYYSTRETILSLPQEVNTVFSENSMYHISILVDYNTGKYVISVDGVEFVRGEMTSEKLAAIKTKKQAYINLAISPWDNSHTYVDNFKFTAYNTLESGVAADSTIDNVFENVKGNVKVSAASANAGTSEVTVNNIYAVYDATGKKLVSVTVDPVTLGANEISCKSYDVNAGDGGVVKVFTWNEAKSSPIIRK